MLNLFKKIFKGGKHDSSEFEHGAVIEITEEDIAPAVWAAQFILYGMFKENIMTLTLKHSSPLPIWLKQYDSGPEPVLDGSVNFDLILNRLKISSNLNPWMSKEPQQGVMELWIQGHPYICKTLFDDTAGEPFVTLTMSLKEGKTSCLVDEIK